MREKITRTNTENSRLLPHLIKTPWKKQKDKTYSIRMTCGSILWLEISPHSRWITCKVNCGNQQIHWRIVRPVWRKKASSLSVIQAGLWVNFSPLPPSPRGGEHMQTAGAVLQAAGRHWSDCQCAGACVQGECRFTRGSLFSSTMWFRLLFTVFPSLAPKHLKGVKI